MGTGRSTPVVVGRGAGLPSGSQAGPAPPRVRPPAALRHAPRWSPRLAV